MRGLSLYLALLFASNLSAQPLTRITDNANTVDDGWGARLPATSRGKVGFISPATGNVFLFDGANTLQQTTNAAISITSDGHVFSVGSGSGATDVVIVWREGTDGGGVWANGAVAIATTQNPFDPAAKVNPEGAAVADGCVYLRARSHVAGTAFNPEHIYQVSTTTGALTLLDGTGTQDQSTSVPTTSGCKAAWRFDPDGLAGGSAVSGNESIYFWNGSQLITNVDSGAVDAPYLKNGKIVYTKLVSGVRQVFLYDTTAPSPSPVALTSYTDATKTVSNPRTDGRHVAWVLSNLNETNPEIVLNGEVQLTSGEMAALSFFKPPFVLDRGQMLWRTSTATLKTLHANTVSTIPFGGTVASLLESIGGVACCAPSLADGYVAFVGLSSDGGTDGEIYRWTLGTPDDSVQPLAPMRVLAASGDSQLTISWDRILGATSYNIYVATQSGVTKTNYASLPGGRRITGATSPHVLGGLTNGATYYVVVTSVEGATEGPNSSQTQATPTAPPPTLTAISPSGGTAGTVLTLTGTNFRSGATVTIGGTTATGVTLINATTMTATAPTLTVGAKDVSVTNSDSSVATLTNGFRYLSSSTWVASSLTGVTFNALGIDRENGAVAYAAAGTSLYKSTDGGITWGALGGQIAGVTVRAVTASGQTVFAASGGKVFRSLDGGASWSTPVDGTDLGETVKSIAIDPITPTTVYAGNFKIVPSTNNYIVKSTNGGANWSQLPDQNFGGPDLRAYNIAVDTVTSGTLYAGGTGMTLVKSVNGGTSWTDVKPASGYSYALAIDPNTPATLYAGIDTFTGSGTLGIFKTVNGAGAWTPKNSGLPVNLSSDSVRFLLVDPANSSVVRALMYSGYYQSSNGADLWTAGNINGMPGAPSHLAIAGARRMLAASGGTLYVILLDPPPTVSSVNVTSGPAAGGTSLTITGTNFRSPATVLFGGVAASGVTVVNSTTITATTPPHAAGQVNVAVTNADGQSGTLLNGFTYLAPPPTISSFLPTSGPPGTSVVITGTNFTGATSTQFNGQTAVFTVDSASQITATVPNAATSGTISVTTSGGTATSASSFTVTSPLPPPTITSVAPDRGPFSGGTSVTINGTNFVNGASVTVGGVAATNVTFNGSTMITATTPAHAVGTATIVVTNPDQQIGTLTNGFTYLGRGDSNGDGTVTVTDLFYLINFLFATGSSPIGPGDANGDGQVTASDLFYLINFLFANGPPPP